MYVADPQITPQLDGQAYLDDALKAAVPWNVLLRSRLKKVVRRSCLHVIEQPLNSGSRSREHRSLPNRFDVIRVGQRLRNGSHVLLCLLL